MINELMTFLIGSSPGDPVTEMAFYIFCGTLAFIMVFGIIDIFYTIAKVFR